MGGDSQSPNSIPKVLILNKDDQLLDAVASAAEKRKKGGTGLTEENPDITHYQMLYQIWRNRPGLCAQRSIALTPNLMFLCDEELCSQEVHLTVLDSASIKDVSKVIAEDDPLNITIVFRPAGVIGITHRKWRLRLPSRSAASKLHDELRK
jgi:hypothetical protein